MRYLKHILAFLLTWILVCGPTYAQMTIVVKHKGGAPSLWTPVGTIVWYKADAITGVSNGSTFTSWPDSSGNSNPATNASPCNVGGSNPTYETNIQNSLPAGLFAGAQCLVSSTFAASSSSTIFLAMGPTSAGYNGVADAGSQYGRLVSCTSGVWGGYTWAVYYTQSISTCAAWAVWAVQFNGASSIESYNGTQQSGTITSVSASQLNIGTIYNHLDGTGLTGYMGEAVLYNSAVDQNLFTCTEGYLAWKWGLQSLLAAGHPYKSAAPTTASSCT